METLSQDETSHGDVADTWPTVLCVAGGFAALLGVSLALWIVFRPGDSTLTFEAASRDGGLAPTGASPTFPPGRTPPPSVAAQSRPPTAIRPAAGPSPFVAAPARVVGTPGPTLVAATLRPIDDGRGAPYLSGTVRIANPAPADVERIDLRVEVGDRVYRLKIEGATAGDGEYAVRTARSVPPGRKVKAVLLTAVMKGGRPPVTDSLSL